MWAVLQMGCGGTDLTDQGPRPTPDCNGARIGTKAYDTVVEAWTAALSGETIYVCAGEHQLTTPLKVTGERRLLFGEGPATQLVSSAPTLFNISDGELTLAGLGLRGDDVSSAVATVQDGGLALVEVDVQGFGILATGEDAIVLVQDAELERGRQGFGLTGKSHLDLVRVNIRDFAGLQAGDGPLIDLRSAGSDSPTLFAEHLRIAGSTAADGILGLHAAPRAPYLSATLQNVNFEGNESSTVGLLSVTGAAVTNHSVALQGQRGTPSQGGGMTIEDAVVSGGVVVGAQALEGGGVWASDAVLSGLRLEDNKAKSGGGAWLENATLRDTRVRRNAADELGGGLTLLGAVTLEGVHIEENTARRGGGFYLQLAEVELDGQSTVHRNRLTTEGELGPGAFMNHSHLISFGDWGTRGDTRDNRPGPDIASFPWNAELVQLEANSEPFTLEHGG